MPIFETKWIDEKVPVFIWKSEKEVEISAIKTSPSTNPRQREQRQGSKLLEYAASILNLPFDCLNKDEHGKPYFSGTPWEFSITHTQDFLAAVFHPDQPVGIDLERPQPKIQKVLPRICTAEEVDWAGNDPIKQCFLWSAKEAMYKLYGKRSVDFRAHLHVLSRESGEIRLPHLSMRVRLISFESDIPHHLLVIAIPELESKK